ncbi:MAG: CoA transferase [Deltaproteobacteria bacterium]|nr:CoA transferase [Deltaproteobacteria bacterium]
MAGILEGIRVIEFAALGGGPLAGLLLGDFGADVIKIENPAGGDPSRNMFHLNERKISTENHSILFEFSNRHKRGITLNLAHERGREIVHRLIEKSDVFFSNYFPRTLKKLGLDYETLAGINPQLIYATSPAFGKKGPDSDKQAYDPMAMARSGMMLAISPTDEPGSMIPGAVADMMGGTFLGFAIMAGILARERSGVGQEIDSSLFGPMLWGQYLNISGYYSGNRLMPKVPRNNTWNPLSNSYQCKDGRWLYLLARDWPELCRVFQFEALEQDPRFADPMARTKNRRELIKILEEAFTARTRDEWIEHIKASNAPNVLYENVNTIPDLANDTQILANDLILEEHHRGLGPIKMLKFPFNFSKTPVATARKEAPCLGEHTDEVLAEYGYSPEEIAQFRKDKVI